MQRRVDGPVRNARSLVDPGGDAEADRRDLAVEQLAHGLLERNDELFLRRRRGRPLAPVLDGSIS